MGLTADGKIYSWGEFNAFNDVYPLIGNNV